MDRLDMLNLAKWLDGMAEGVNEQLDDPDGVQEEMSARDGALRDYFGQMCSVAMELRTAAAERRPLDWDTLDDQIGTDLIERS